MRVFVGAFFHETNALAPPPVSLSTFKETGYCEPGERPVNCGDAMSLLETFEKYVGQEGGNR